MVVYYIEGPLVERDRFVMLKEVITYLSPNIESVVLFEGGFDRKLRFGGRQKIKFAQNGLCILIFASLIVAPRQKEHRLPNGVA